jgi:hypothetical protein
LTANQIQQAIAFNSERFDAVNTRLIQDLLGGPITGAWTAENIEAIAAIQEQFGLQKDGKIGPEMFRFLNTEQQAEGAATDTPHCLTEFRILGPDRPTIRRLNANQCSILGLFRTASQFSSLCDCSQFEYRQFIRGHFRRERGGTVTDLSGIFIGEPGGSLPTTFQEDSDTNDPVAPFYGHRNAAPNPDPEDHYLDDQLNDDQAHGCLYRSQDVPGANQINDCQTGDIYDLEMDFRGEIRRGGASIQTKFWTGIRDRFPAP